MVRPKKHSPREVRLMTRVTTEEARQIRDKADTAGMSVSAFLAIAGTTQEVNTKEVPPVNRKLYLELSRYNSNLNQIAHHLNEGRRFISGETEDILHNMRRMYALIRAVREGLLG